jgi:hypothetical protein
MPSYYESRLNLAKTLADFEAGYAKATGYNKWMYGRRVGEYIWFLRHLRQAIHESILGLEGQTVCNCALLYSDKESPLLAEGHRDHSGQVTRTFFFFKYEAEKPRTLMMHCQLCGETQVAEVDEEGHPVSEPKCTCGIQDPGLGFEI